VLQIIASALLAKYWVEAMDMDVIILALINGIVVGLGVTIGSYIANKALIQQLESALNKLKKEFKNGKPEQDA
jgi:predicted choloylglycine hydrolase